MLNSFLEYRAKPFLVARVRVSCYVLVCFGFGHGVDMLGVVLVLCLCIDLFASDPLCSVQQKDIEAKRPRTTKAKAAASECAQPSEAEASASEAASC